MIMGHNSDKTAGGCSEGLWQGQTDRGKLQLLTLQSSTTSKIFTTGKADPGCASCTHKKEPAYL